MQSWQDKIEEIKSHLRADYKKKLYDALVESYNTNKDLFNTYGEVFTLKRIQDDSDKDRDPSAGSKRGTKRRKSRKEVESSKDSRSKEKKSSRTSKDASQSQHKSSGKSAHTEEPSHTVDDSGVQQDQEFDTGNNDEQPANKEVSKDDCQVARAKEPRSSFDELIDTSFDFSAFVLNWLNIKDLTQEILVGPAFELLKGTCKSLTELEYHLEECSKATTERLDWHNPEGKPYPFDLSKPLPLIRDHRGRQVIPQDFFINNDLEYLKGGDLSRRYSTSVTKTKAATYEIKWIEDLVQNLWSPVKFAANMSSSKDVYSRKRIIAVTRLTIMKKYDYGHLEEIEVRREDQKLYKFREGDFPRLRLQDIEDMLLLLVQKKLTNLIIDERYDLNVALRNKDGISAKEKMEWFRQTKGSGYGLGYRQATLREEVDAEFREVHWFPDRGKGKTVILLKSKKEKAVINAFQKSFLPFIWLYLLSKSGNDLPNHFKTRFSSRTSLFQRSKEELHLALFRSINKRNLIVDMVCVWAKNLWYVVFPSESEKMITPKANEVRHAIDNTLFNETARDATPTLPLTSTPVAPAFAATPTLPLGTIVR
ncbi:hypothetical protein Tco_1555315 [Tanacetum coccineum]